MIELTHEELRAIIEGRVRFRRCPNCEGTGRVYWEEFEGSFEQRTISQHEWNELGGRQSTAHVLGDECCEVCEGLRYVTNDI